MFVGKRKVKENTFGQKGRVARFFLVLDTKTGKVNQMNAKCIKWS
jgi:hypothetical protein